MAQKQAAASSAASASTPRRTRSRRLRFIAAVRFSDGQRGRFSVDNAKTPEEARLMVLDELQDVASVLVSVW